jgi:phage anti-repressor protein
MKKHIIWLFILFSNLLIAQNNEELFFEESIYSVEIQIENGKNYLELDKENKIQIVTKNIDPVNFACSGRDLRRGDFSNRINITSWIATVSNEGLKDGKYSLTIRFKGKRGKLFQHQFLIPVKQ